MDKKAPTYLISEDYYIKTDKMAVEVENKINHELKSILKYYMDYLKCYKIEKLRTHSEYGLELLYIGVLYISYSKKEKLTFYDQLSDLYFWLESSKEFEEITTRFKMWLDYWKDSESLSEDFLIIFKLAKDFIEQSEKELKQFTINIPEFIRNAELTYKNRDDFIFVTRHVNEYFVNMVGAQILNRVFRESFKKVDELFIFVPGCMAGQLDKCKAEKGTKGYICTKCTEDCPVCLAAQTGEKYNAKTIIVYHSSELYHTKTPVESKKYGVIGIACVLNLISGGLKAKELGYIPQCVPLNYCGCRQHWDYKGLVTDIDRERLEEILE